MHAHNDRVSTKVNFLLSTKFYPNFVEISMFRFSKIPISMSKSEFRFRLFTCDKIEIPRKLISMETLQNDNVNESFICLCSSNDCINVHLIKVFDVCWCGYALFHTRICIWCCIANMNYCKVESFTLLHKNWTVFVKICFIFHIIITRNGSWKRHPWKVD
jgi:hypothetical protein